MIVEQDDRATVFTLMLPTGDDHSVQLPIGNLMPNERWILKRL